MLGLYERTLKWVLDHQVFMLIVALAVIVATVWLYYVRAEGFLPATRHRHLMGTTEAAQDISFTAMKEKQEQVAAIGPLRSGRADRGLVSSAAARFHREQWPHVYHPETHSWGKDHRRDDAGT